MLKHTTLVSVTFLVLLSIQSTFGASNLMPAYYGFNLHGDWTRYLYAYTNTQKYSEQVAGNATFWRPTVPGIEGNVIYRFPFTNAISSASLLAGISVWTTGDEFPYDPGASAYLDVSPDGTNWTNLDGRYANRGGGSQGPYDITTNVKGSRWVWVRARLKGTASWPTDGLIFAQFLRVGPGDTNHSLQLLAQVEVPTNMPPTITSQPVSVMATVGSAASFSITAVGTAPLGYEWRKDEVRLTGATNASLTLVNLQTNQAGNYRVVVTNSVGSVTSAVATLLVSEPARDNPTMVVDPRTHALALSRFGSSFAFSGDALAVGQALNGGVGALPQANSGQIHVFRLGSNAANKVGTILAPDTVYDGAAFGFSVGVSGNTLFAGCPNTYRVGAHDGTGYLYSGVTNSPVLISKWTEFPSQWAGYFAALGRLVGDALVVSQGSNPQWGSRAGVFFYKVDAAGSRTPVFSFMAPDTDRSVGAIGLSSNRCAVFWYSRANTNNSQLLILNLTRNGSGSFIGVTTNLVIGLTNVFHPSVFGLGIDGNLVALGEATANVGSNDCGRVRVWRLNGGVAAQLPSLVPPDLRQGGRFGECVYIRQDVIGVGSPVVPGFSNAQGCVYIYKTSSNSEPYLFKKLQPTAPRVGAGEYFGNPIAWDGSRLLVGSSGGWDRTGGGVLYVYDVNSTFGLTQPPVITSQPSDITVSAGQPAAFDVTANGTAPLSYQWRRNGVAIPGANQTNLVIASATVFDGAGYDVVLTNEFGGVTSRVAALTVLGPPIIVAQPQGATGVVGSAVSLLVDAVGPGPLWYHWYKDGVPLPMATNSLLTLGNLRPVHLGDYRVVVTNAYGSATSSTAVVRLDGVDPSAGMGLLAWYPFNGNANDESGFANHGIANGAWFDSDRHGTSSAACFLGGTSTNFIELPDSAAFKSTNYTVSLWFKAGGWPSGSDTASMLLSKGQNNFEVHLGSPVTGQSGIRFLPRLNAPGVENHWDSPAGSYTTNAWTHLTVTFNPSGDRVSIYVNGRQMPLTGRTNPLDGADLPGPARLGTRAGQGLLGFNPFLGHLDDVRIYNRELTRHEAQSLYQIESQDTDRDGLSDAYEQGFGRYEIVPGRITWAQARADAESRGGHLATITSPQEWELIQAVLGPGSLKASGPGVVWLGATDELSEGDWRWVTGERWQYQRWSPGQPSQQFGGGNEDFLISWTDLPDGPGWNDGAETLPGELQGYLLEYGYFTDPRNADTDLDGFGDGDELTAGSSPVDPTQIPPNRFNQFVLVAGSAGGGLVTPDPLYSSYPSNRIVEVTARPAAGWSFLGWQGDALGAAEVQTLSMSRSICVRAVFGTPVARNVIGAGSVRVMPEAVRYPYGTVLNLVAEPQPGNYFVRWTNAVSGPQSPRSFAVFTANPLLTARFAPLQPGHYALTLIPDGPGQVVALPQTNQYPAGTMVTLYAQPEAGSSFLGWLGGATGVSNPLTLTMDQSRVVTAVFTRKARVEMLQCLGQPRPGPFTLTVLGSLGDRYSIQDSFDMSAWRPVALVSNVLGSAQWSDINSGADEKKFYRVLVQP